MGLLRGWQTFRWAARGGCPAPAPRIWVVCSLLIALLACSPALSPVAVGATDQKPGALSGLKTPPVAYLLVLDHSGSMGTRQASGRTRWEEERDNVIALASGVPLETHIWLALFSAPVENVRMTSLNIETEEDRQEFIQRVRSDYGAPSGRTAYRDTLALAFKHAEELSKANPGRPIAVVGYTDGEDNESKITEDELNAIEAKLKQLNKNVWVITTEGTEVPVWVHVNLSPLEVNLESPKTQAQQTVHLECQSDDARFAEDVDGRPVSWTYVPASGDPLRAEVKGGPYALHKGRVSIELAVTNADALAPESEYHGALKPDYGNTQKQRVQVIGPDAISVTFSAIAKPPLDVMAPRSPSGEAGGTFPTRQPVLFRASTLPNADVLWQFGDGVSAEGAGTSYQYNVPGTYEASVTATRPSDGATATLKFTMELVDVGVEVKPLQTAVCAKVPFTFSCTKRGPVRTVTWTVDGLEYPAEGADGTELTYVFQNAGTHLVRAVGYAEGITVQSPELSVRVGEPPSVTITEPGNASTYTFGQEIVLGAAVTGPVDGVTWRLVRKSDGAEIAQIASRGAPVPPLHYAVPETYHVPSGPADATTVTVQAVGIMGEGVPKGLQVPPRTVDIRLTPPERKLLIAQPTTRDWRFPSDWSEAEGAKVTVPFAAELTGPGMDAVDWKVVRLSDGSTVAKGTAPVTAGEGGQVAHWTVNFSQDTLRPNSLLERVAVSATARLSGVPTQPPTHSIEATVGFAETAPQIVAAQEEYTFSEQAERGITFRVKWGQPIAKCAWDFGDGGRAEGLEATHSYAAYGEYTVTADVVGRDGSQHKATVPVRVICRKPEPVLDVRYKGALLGQQVHRIPVGATLKLDHQSKGDFTEAAWLYNGEPATGSVTVRQPGNNEIVLRLQAPPGRGAPAQESVSASIAFYSFVPRPVEFALVVLSALVLFAIVWRLTTGNQPAAWRVNYGRGEEAPMPLRAGKYWSRWHKRAIIAMSAMFKSPHWRSGGGKRDALILRCLGKRKGMYDGNLSFSSERDPGVTWEETKSTPRAREYTLVDARAPADEPYREVYLHLEKRVSSRGADVAIKVLAFCVLCGAIMAAWNFLEPW